MTVAMETRHPRGEITRLDIRSSAGGDGAAASLRCHPGLVRIENQDSVARFSVPLGELFVVADGVGGQSGGRRASTLVIEEYGRSLAAAPATADPTKALEQATASVSRRLAEEREHGEEDTRTMASTVALVLLHGQTAHVGHLGDSRVYRMRLGTFSLLTRDHSIVRQMVDRGILSPDQAESHPKAHILTRSLGQSDAELELSSYDLEKGDILLLCSDGLWAYVPEDQIVTMLSDAIRDTAKSADALLVHALGAGGSDNIGIVLLRIGEPSSSRRPLLSRRFGFLFAVVLFLLLGCVIWFIAL